MPGSRRIRIRSEELDGKECTVDLDRMEYVLENGTRRRVGHRFQYSIQAVYDRQKAAHTHFGFSSYNIYGPASGSGLEPRRASSSTVPPHQDGDADEPDRQLSSNGSVASGSAKSNSSTRTPARKDSPRRVTPDAGLSSSTAAIERRQLLIELMRVHRVSGRDAIAVADLVEDGHDIDAAKSIHRLIKSGSEPEAAVRISALMDEGHSEAVAVQARELEEQDRSSGTALAMARLMVRGESEEAAESAIYLMRKGMQAAPALRIGRLRDTGSSRGMIEVIGTLVASNYTFLEAIRIARNTEDGMGLAAAIQAESNRSP